MNHCACNTFSSSNFFYFLEKSSSADFQEILNFKKSSVSATLTSDNINADMTSTRVDHISYHAHIACLNMIQYTTAIEMQQLIESNMLIRA